MNFQKLFDDAWRQIHKQGRGSFIGEGDSFECRYRSPDGCMCNFGPAIPDDKYDKVMMEGRVASAILHELGMEWGASRLKAESFVDELQGAHDKACRIRHEDGEGYPYWTINSPEEFMAAYVVNMTALADKWSLTVPQI